MHKSFDISGYWEQNWIIEVFNQKVKYFPKGNQNIKPTKQTNTDS